MEFRFYGVSGCDIENRLSECESGGFLQARQSGAKVRILGIAAIEEDFAVEEDFNVSVSLKLLSQLSPNDRLFEILHVSTVLYLLVFRYFASQWFG